jgi:hypothetical protein
LEKGTGNSWLLAKASHKVENEYFKENFSNSIIQFTISNNLQLKMEILTATAPDFFTEEDFTELAKFSGLRMDKAIPAQQETYAFLKLTYAKTEYWARQVQKQVFPNGHVKVIQKPTNQAARFESYHWAKIYPDKISLEYEAIAFTVGIEVSKQLSINRFTVKIDTVSLPDSGERRKKYLQLRGDYNNSKLVKHLQDIQILDKGWDYLIDITNNIILSLKPTFDSLFQSFTGIAETTTTEVPEKDIATALNTILYGPPGTGKTYTMQSMCDKFMVTKNVQTKEEYLEELIDNLTWWETVAASLMVLKKSPVPELEKHEFVKIKAKQSGTKNVKQILWGSLQAHTDPSFTNVQVARRVEPFIFKKEDNSIWTVQEENVRNEVPEVIDFLANVKNFNPALQSTHKNFRMVTFHQNFSYEDFVEGIKPELNKYATEDLEYVIEKGVFYQCCNDAVKLAGYDNLDECINDTKEGRKEKINTAIPYALFIDEVNRANVSAVFGELITLIEDDKRLGRDNEIIDIILPYSKKRFGVPGNLYIIGTMNTADRSVEALDTALRRRFTFEQMAPNSSLLHPKRLLLSFWNIYERMGITYDVWIKEPYKSISEAFNTLIGLDRKLEQKLIDDNASNEIKEWVIDDFRNLADSDFTGIRLDWVLEKINARLESLLTKDHTIGHAWLMNVYNLKDLQAAFKNKILPLLQEYFYNDYAKIGLVLGKRFVETRRFGQKIFASFDDGNDLAAEYADKMLYTLKDPRNLTLEDFISIYQ